MGSHGTSVRGTRPSRGSGNRRCCSRFRGYLESVTWSQDGTRLAMTAYRIPEGQDGVGKPELMMLEVDPSGNVMGEPKVLDAPDMVWWSPHWLPNGRGLLVVGERWQHLAGVPGG